MNHLPVTSSLLLSSTATFDHILITVTFLSSFLKVFETLIELIAELMSFIPIFCWIHIYREIKNKKQTHTFPTLFWHPSTHISYLPTHCIRFHFHLQPLLVQTNVYYSVSVIHFFFSTVCLPFMSCIYSWSWNIQPSKNLLPAFPFFCCNLPFFYLLPSWRLRWVGSQM